MQSTSDTYSEIWQSVRAKYNRGFCVSERGLQAVLYEAITKALPGVDVVVEPGWTDGATGYVPDLVIVENGEITDVFEIKFKPYSYADLQPDIRKLLDYGSTLTEAPVSIDPVTGKWLSALSFSPQLRRHFVAVADSKAAAVWRESLKKEVPELAAHTGPFFNWFGRIGAADARDQEWAFES